MIDRKILGYFSMVFVFALCYALFLAEQYVFLAIIGIVYLAFVFGIDKFKIDLKNKKVELEDENRDT
jgi:energy-coupling factor transporter transmembrane protein EcfT